MLSALESIMPVTLGTVTGVDVTPIETFRVTTSPLETFLPGAGSVAMTVPLALFEAT